MSFLNEYRDATFQFGDDFFGDEPAGGGGITEEELQNDPNTELVSPGVYVYTNPDTGATREFRKNSSGFYSAQSLQKPDSPASSGPAFTGFTEQQLVDAGATPLGPGQYQLTQDGITQLYRINSRGNYAPSGTPKDASTGDTVPGLILTPRDPETGGPVSVLQEFEDRKFDFPQDPGLNEFATPFSLDFGGDFGEAEIRTGVGGTGSAYLDLNPDVAGLENLGFDYDQVVRVLGFDPSQFSAAEKAAAATNFFVQSQNLQNQGFSATEAATVLRGQYKPPQPSVLDVYDEAGNAVGQRSGTGAGVNQALQRRPGGGFTALGTPSSAFYNPGRDFDQGGEMEFDEPAQGVLVGEESGQVQPFTTEANERISFDPRTPDEVSRGLSKGSTHTRFASRLKSVERARLRMIERAALMRSAQAYNRAKRAYYYGRAFPSFEEYRNGGRNGQSFEGDVVGGDRREGGGYGAGVRTPRIQSGAWQPSVTDAVSDEGGGYGAGVTTPRIQSLMASLGAAPVF